MGRNTGFRPQQSWVPARFAVQARCQGAELLEQGRTAGWYSMGVTDWKHFIRAAAKTLLSNGEGLRGEAAFLKASEDVCLLAGTPSLTAALTGSTWVQGAVFQHKDAYWQVRLPEPSASDIKGCGGLKCPARLMRQAQKSVSYNVHHLLTWWAWGAPPGNGYDQALHWRCGNKLCLNPHHLCWGSAKDNAYHRTFHGERRRGLHSASDHPEKHVPAGWESAREKAKQQKKPRSHKGPR